MRNKSFYLALLAFSLSMFNLGIMAAKYYYKPQIETLQKQVKTLEARKPVIIYHVNNFGSGTVGKITDKEQINNLYTVTVGAYGKFLVTKEQYDSLKIGDDVPEYLKERGN